MAYAKNKYSSKMHAHRTRFLSSREKTPAQKITLAIIISATILVIISVLCIFILDNERIAKSKISSLASEYYENYFYPSMSIEKDELADVMSDFLETGFNNVNLRQLILATGKDHSADADFLRKYCDEKSTIIRFFPEPPFDKTSYHVEYSYSCDF